MTRRLRLVREERGSVTPLIIGFALILATLVGVVVDASAAYLRRQSLDTLADSAALAATDGLQGEAVYTGGLGDAAEIDPGAAERYANAYLADSGARARYPGLTVQIVTGGNVVRVRLAAPLDLPLNVPGITPPTVTGEAASQVRVSD